MIIKDLHEKFMRVALDEANASKHKGEWFGGAVVVKNGEIIAKAQNTVRSSNDPTAHSEINAIKDLALKNVNFQRSSEITKKLYQIVYWIFLTIVLFCSL